MYQYMIFYIKTVELIPRDAINQMLKCSDQKNLFLTKKVFRSVMYINAVAFRHFQNLCSSSDAQASVEI